MKKEEWINEVLDSTKGMQKAEAPPFLQEKIMGRIQTASSAVMEKPSLQWAFALTAIVLIAINVFTVLPKDHAPKAALQKNAGAGFDNSTVYMY